MGLSIAVGLLAKLLIEDPGGAEWIQQDLAGANQLLATAGIPTHDEPASLPEMDNRCQVVGFPYSFLHHLRRVYAYSKAQPDWQPTPTPEGQDPARDPVVEQETFMMSSHLLCHSDAEGMYLPVDFDAIITGDIAGRVVGSSNQLRRDLEFTAPRLGIQLDQGALPDTEAARLNQSIETEQLWATEHLAWLSHWEATRLSLTHNTAIVYT